MPHTPAPLGAHPQFVISLWRGVQDGHPQDHHVVFRTVTVGMIAARDTLSRYLRHALEATSHLGFDRVNMQSDADLRARSFRLGYPPREIQGGYYAQIESLDDVVTWLALVNRMRVTIHRAVHSTTDDDAACASCKAAAQAAAGQAMAEMRSVGVQVAP